MGQSPHAQALRLWSPRATSMRSSCVRGQGVYVHDAFTCSHVTRPLQPTCAHSRPRLTHVTVSRTITYAPIMRRVMTRETWRVHADGWAWMGAHIYTRAEPSKLEGFRGCASVHPHASTYEGCRFTFARSETRNSLIFNKKDGGGWVCGCGFHKYILPRNFRSHFPKIFSLL